MLATSRIVQPKNPSSQLALPKKSSRKQSYTYGSRGYIAEKRDTVRYSFGYN